MLHLSGALSAGQVSSVDIETIGEDTGITSHVIRLRMAYATGNSAPGPPSLVAKLPSLNRSVRAEIQLAQGYEREIRFFQHLAPPCPMTIPRCHLAAVDEHASAPRRSASRRYAQHLPARLKAMLLPAALWVNRYYERRSFLLLEDLTSLQPGSQAEGADSETAALAARSLASLHAMFWNDRSLEHENWLPHRLGIAKGRRSHHRLNWDRFYRNLNEQPPPHFRAAMDWADQHLESIMSQLERLPNTLLHGDYHLNNLFFDGTRVVTIDWGSVSRGPGVLDWAYFATGNLHDEIDEEKERNIVGSYHQALCRQGISNYDLDTCYRDYMLAKVFIAYNRFSENPGNENRLFRRLPEQQWDRFLE